MWELLEVTSEKECMLDNSGVYTVISFTSDEKIRVDLMTTDDEPVISWQGHNVDALRKDVISVLSMEPDFSAEHASYIGAELIRCELMESAYVQN